MHKTRKRKKNKKIENWSQRNKVISHKKHKLSQCFVYGLSHAQSSIRIRRALHWHLHFFLFASRPPSLPFWRLTKRWPLTRLLVHPTVVTLYTSACVLRHTIQYLLIHSLCVETHVRDMQHVRLPHQLSLRPRKRLTRVLIIQVVRSAPEKTAFESVCMYGQCLLCRQGPYFVRVACELHFHTVWSQPTLAELRFVFVVP